jgi:type I restriction enzyme S subunit
LARIELATNQQFNGLQLFHGYIVPEYLYFFATTLSDTLRQLAGATTFGFVSVSKLSNISIPVPPLAEQRRIIAAIEVAFEQLDEIAATLA